MNKARMKFALGLLTATALTTFAPISAMAQVAADANSILSAPTYPCKIGGAWGTCVNDALGKLSSGAGFKSAPISTVQLLSLGVIVPLSSTSDNTASLQSAVTLACSRNLIITLQGSGAASGNLSIPCSLGLRGQGRNTTFLSLTNAGNAITVNGTGAVEFADLTLETSVATSTAVVVQPTSGANFGSRFQNVAFAGFKNSLYFVAASGFRVSDCTFTTSVTNAQELTVKNTNNADAGDSTVTNTIFNATPATNTVAIQYESSGGLRVQNNKFNGADYDLYMSLAAGASTSDLLFTGNSVEGYQDALVFQRASTTGIFNNVVISANQFATNNTSSQTVWIPLDSTGPWLKSFSVTSNVFNLGSTSRMLKKDRAT